MQDDLGIACQAGGAIAQRARREDTLSWELLRYEPLIENPLCHLVEHPVLSNAIATCNLEARNTTALLSFVRAGLGATILPRRAFDSEQDNLMFLAPVNPLVRRELRKISPGNIGFSPAVEAFWEAL